MTSSVSGMAGAGGGGKPTAAPLLSTGPAKPLVLSTATPFAAIDRKRIAAAKGPLGAGFTQLEAGVLLDAETGAAVGTSATFRATDGGGTVGIAWSDILQATVVAVGGSSVSGVGMPAITASAPAPAPVSVDAAKSPAATSVDPAPDVSPDLLGDISSDGKTIISLKIVQGAVGSPPILAGSARPAFVQQLLTLSE